MQTGVGHITILQLGSAVVACLLAGLAWVMLRKNTGLGCAPIECRICRWF